MNKRKIGIIAVLSMLNIPLSIFLSATIHTKLAKIEFSEIVVDIFSCLSPCRSYDFYAIWVK